MSKKIVLISHNDILGGAAIVTYRLMRTLRQMGHDAQMLVFNKQSDDEHVHQLSSFAGRAMSFMRERIDIFAHNGFDRANLFKVSTGKTGLSVANHPLVRQADAVLVNWVNQGTVSLKDIAKISRTKRVIWTMHDMWPMTGICHHAYDCTRYTDKCGDCPMLGPAAKPHDLSNRIWQYKHDIYANADIRFVAVSNWARECARRSSLLRDRDVHVIHNAFPSELFPVVPDRPMPPMFKPGYDRAIVFGAARLDDPIKGIDYAIDALNLLYERCDAAVAGAVAIFFGATRNPELLDRLKFPHYYCGTISNYVDLQHLYCAARVVLSTSKYENLPGTLIEGMSAGAIPVTFGRGGQADIVDHKVNGYIARYPDIADIADGIVWAFNSGISRQSLHDTIAERFDAHKIARQYLALIDA